MALSHNNVVKFSTKKIVYCLDSNVISLGRPEVFEKVAKIGVGVHIWLLKVSKLTHH